MADRLWYGSIEVARRRANRITAWIKAAPTSRGSWVRLGVVVGLGWIAVRTIRAAPGLLWVITAGWLWAAYRAGRDHAPEAATEDADDAPAEPPGEQSAEAVRTLLLDLMGDARGVHLKTVLAHLQKEGQGVGWTVTDLRLRLEALGIPVEPLLKLNKVPTRGVLKADLLAPSPAEAPNPSPEASTAA
ncbi:hypothetical protein [Streptomyces sp. NRRL S-337]|uniref:hypothetical protein n=1 Tax=Streptomyces sp. NRRL S-337 TaxID=1463900 RepID=UPI00131B7E4D|nr:hypothetical protein [Streptomyces sp. NRRL S-337]